MPRKSMALGAKLREDRNTKADIGFRIAHQRAILGYSQEELAGRLGVSRAALSQYELGISDVNAGDMNYFAEILKMPVSHFFYNKAGWEQDEADENLAIMNEYFPFLPLDAQNVLVDVITSSYSREIEKAGSEELLHQKVRTKGS